jgi:hypothetical protein
MAVNPQWLGTFNQPMPDRPLRPITNYGQAIGQALTTGGNIVEHQQDILQKMIQARMKAEEDKQRTWLLQKEDERQAAEEARKADAEKRRLEFLAKVAKGKEISPTLAKDPSLAGPSQPSSLPSAQELAQLELDGPQGARMPNQAVNGMDSTRLMGEALIRPEIRGDMASGTAPYSRDEIPGLALQTGQMTPGDYMTSTKPPGRVQVHVIGDRKVLVNLDTHDVTDLGPAPKPVPRAEPRDRYVVKTIDGREVKVNLDTNEQTDIGPAAEKPPKPPTEDQSKAAGFARRMELAEHDLAQVAATGYDRTGSIESAQAAGPSGLNSSKGQRWSNAEKNFATANLRKESGAVIGDEEMANQERLYFPRWNDSEETKAQKARNRAQAFEGMKAAAGAQFEKVKSMIPRDFSKVTETDIDSMSPEELKAFLDQ